MAKAKATTQQLQLTVKRRDATGTRPVNRLRAQGLVPGVVYGKGMASVAVMVPRHELVKVLHAKAGEHALVAVRLEGADGWEKPALLQAVAHDPVDGHVLHVDFHTIVLTERLRVKVPVVLHGEAVGVKQDGGVLEHFLREVEIECLPTDIPKQVAFDISALKIGDTVHVRELSVPKSARITSDPDGVIASVQKPKEEKPEEAPAAPAEPEVLREKKEEAAAAPEEGKAEAAEEPKKEKDAKS